MSKNNLKYLKPINNSSRNTVLISRTNLWKNGPFKGLIERICRTGGRNNRGIITSRHRGGGCRKIYRIIDFHRCKDNQKAVVERIEYDPNRTAFIALIRYEDNTYNYIIAPDKLKPGMTIYSGIKGQIEVGNCFELANIPIGTMIHNIELIPGEGAKMVRSAGGFAYLSGKESGFAILKMPSKELRKIPLSCRATIGIISNIDYMHVNIGKAGRNRHKGIRPLTRGIATNPVDHHNGGRTNGGKIFKNWTGRIVKGARTKRRFNNMIISRRKK